MALGKESEPERLDSRFKVSRAQNQDGGGGGGGGGGGDGGACGGHADVLG
jgi:hypothetical protein